MLATVSKLWAQENGIYVFGRATSLDPSLRSDSTLIVAVASNEGDSAFVIAAPPNFRYKFSLPFGSIHRLHYSMRGHISDQVVIYANNMPTDGQARGYGMNVDMLLLPVRTATDSSLLAPQRAIARYDTDSDEMMWHVDSASQIRYDGLRRECQAIIDEKFTARVLDRKRDSSGAFYPTIPLRGRSEEDFIPEHWRLIKAARGDMNGDLIPDMALAIEYEDTITHFRPDGLLSRGRPTTLLVAIQERSGDLKMVVRNNDFLLRSDEMPLAPPGLDLAITSTGDLLINYQFTRGKAWYTFDLVLGGLECVAYEGASVDTGEIITVTELDVSGRRLTRKTGHTTSSGMEEEVLTMPSGLNFSMDALGRPFRTELAQGLIF